MDPHDQWSAAFAVCQHHVALRSEPRHATRAMLRGDAAKVPKRLVRILRRGKQQLARSETTKPPDIDLRFDRAGSRRPTGQRIVACPNWSAGGAAVDDGRMLVALIERVIAPEFWQTQGGPGVIKYCARKRALVVRATTDVHLQIAGLLSALR